MTSPRRCQLSQDQKAGCSLVTRVGVYETRHGGRTGGVQEEVAWEAGWFRQEESVQRWKKCLSAYVLSSVLPDLS